MTDDLTGRTLGQYAIKSLLGKGGMAKVYAATQASMNRDVAIKVMNVELSSNPLFVSRFKQEASVIAQLEHPHILPVIDFGQENNFLFIVMRLVKGDSLDQRLRQGPVHPSKSIELLRQIGSALGFAHEHNVIHRDLKPSNVLLDEYDNSYLADFGIAKLTTSENHLTDTHSVLGTPHYMAPEQWRAEAIDGRTDIYSLGVLAYQMLTGRLPFAADTPFHIMHHHVNTPPPPLPTETLNPIPEGLGEIIHKALAKDPQDRYQTAQEMIDALLMIGYSGTASQQLQHQTASSEKVPAAATLFDADEMATITGDAIDTAATLQQPLTPLPTLLTMSGSSESVTFNESKTTSPVHMFNPLLLGLVAIVVIAVIGVGVFLALSGDDKPDVDTEVDNLALLTSPVLEDFEDNELGWDRNEANRYVEDGKYHTLVLPNEGGSGLSLAQNLAPVANVRIEVEAQDLSEADVQITYAVLWRVLDTSNYYRFTVTSDGQAGVIKRVAGEDIPLATTTLFDWDSSPAAQQRQHILGVEMVDSQMVLYVDNQVVLRENDDSLPEAGGIGLVAFREGAHVAWDNLQITPIAQLSDPPELVMEPYKETFQNNACRWADQTFVDAMMVAYLADGQYHLQIPEGRNGMQVRCATMGLFNDMHLSVEVENQTPAGTPSAFGIVFRQSADAQTYYVMVVNDRGQISFQKNLPDNPDCQPCTIGVEAIPGYLFDEPHVIALDVVGDTLRGLVDGEIRIEVTDSDISGAGIVRLGAYLPEAHIVFDDLSIDPNTPLPTYIREASSLPTAPLVLSEYNIPISIPADMGAMAFGELSQTPLQNFVLQTTLDFADETEDNDQCGFMFRVAGLNQERFVWLNISRAGTVAFGTQDAMPAQPLLVEKILTFADPHQIDMTVVARDDSINLYIDGELVRASMALSDPDPVAGLLYGWVVLSSNHAATCQLDNLQVWSLD